MSERRAQPTTREEQALIDVSHAAVGRGTGLAMVIVFLALLVAVPIVDTVHQLRSAAAAGPDRSAWSQVALLDLIRDPPQPDDFTAPIHWRSEPERNRLHDYERLIEDSSLLRSSVQPVVQTALTSLFRAGNSQVIRGVDDWLFYRAGVDYCAGLGFLSKDQHDVVPRRHPDAIAAIVDLHRACSARGVRLVVLPVPDKAMIHPDKLVPGSYGEVDNPDYPRFAERLTEAGVDVWSPSALMRQAASGGDVFLRQDTHWTPQTMATVARGLVQHLSLPAARHPRAWSTIRQDVARHGDLVDTLKLTPEQRIFRPQLITVEQVRDAQTGEPWSPNDDAEVLLLGDSFTNIFTAPRMGWGESAGFAPHLALLLRRDIDVIAINGGGASAARQELAKRRGFLQGKTVLIWQFSARDLAMESWRRIDWPEVGAAAAPDGPATMSERRELHIEVLAVSDIQDPAKATYPDAMTTIRGRVVVDAASGSGHEELLLVAECMRQRRLLPAARWKVGDRLRVTVVPWSTVPHRHGEHRYDDSGSFDLLEWYVSGQTP